jgi:hypothetical protein
MEMVGEVHLYGGGGGGNGRKHAVACFMFAVYFKLTYYIVAEFKRGRRTEDAFIIQQVQLSSRDSINRYFRRNSCCAVLMN